MTGNNPPDQSPKANLRATRVLFGALVAGVVMFSLVMIAVNQLGKQTLLPTDRYRDIFLGVAIVAAVICFLAARTTYMKGLTAVKNLTGSLNDRLNFHRSFFIRYMALCEGPALFSIIVYFLTGDLRVMAVAAVMLGTMFLQAPTKKKMISDLGLDWKDEQEL